MARQFDALQGWLAGSRGTRLQFSDLWKIVLIRMADRATDRVDEEGQTIGRRDWWEYAYDLSSMSDQDEIIAYPGDLQRVALYLEQHGWIDLARRQPIKARLMPTGMSKAEELLSAISNAASVTAQRDESRNLRPASDRFVRLDHNSSEYAEAMACLEELIRDTNEIRINDWPEKEGIVVALRSALEMIKSKYVNKQAVFAAVSGATAYILLKFADAPLSDLANRTWNAVKALF